MKFSTIVATVLLLALLTGCAEKSLTQQREDLARAATVNTPIRIGFVWPFSAEYDLLPEGVYMAVNEINSDRVVCDPVPTETPENTGNPAGDVEPTADADATAAPETTVSADTTSEPDVTPGSDAVAATEVTAPSARSCRIEQGLLGGRKIELVEQDDEESSRKSRLIAQELAEQTDVIAVIGQAYSSLSILSAPLYEFNGVIMLSPAATSPDLTANGYKYVFRNVLSDNETGRQLANYVLQQGYSRIVILYYADSYGRQLSNVFENEAGRLNLTIVDRRPYEGPRNFAPVLDEWVNLEFDAILIAGYNPDAALFIAEARRRGLQQPVIGSDGLDTGSLLTDGGQAATGTIVGSFFAFDRPDAEVQSFVIRFQNEYNVSPDTWAALGYDAVWLLADAITRAGSTVPSKVAEALHATKDWQGVTGSHTFNENGDVVGKPLVLKIQEADGLKFLQLASTEQE